MLNVKLGYNILIVYVSLLFDSNYIVFDFREPTQPAEPDLAYTTHTMYTVHVHGGHFLKKL